MKVAPLLLFAACCAACGRAASSTEGGDAGDERVRDSGDVVDAADAGPVHHYELALPYTSTGEVDVYDLDDGFALARSFTLPPLAGLVPDSIRGIVAAPATGTLYVSWNPGSLLACDYATGRVLWTQTYPGGIDSMAATPDGRTLFMPSGGGSDPGLWLAIDASTGAVKGSIHSGAMHPHNTLVTLDGGRVLLGPLGSDALIVADTRTLIPVGAVGPTTNGVRPFTTNGRGTLVFLTTSSLLGYFVGDVATGAILFTVTPPGFSWSQPSYAGTTGIAHGLSLSPDERELWLLDYPHSYVHVFDATKLPAAAPADVADIPLVTPLTGEGWLQHTRDGRLVVVGNSGDVLDTRTRTVVGELPALRQSRIFTEIHVQAGRIVWSPLSRNQGGYVQ